MDAEAFGTHLLAPEPSWAVSSHLHAEILDLQLGVQQQNISEIVCVCFSSNLMCQTSLPVIKTRNKDQT